MCNTYLLREGVFETLQGILVTLIYEMDDFIKK